jgi:ferredoxin--NADP+ reductase
VYRIIEKRRLNDEVTLMRVEAPYVARRALPGQFVMLRADENGERIPLTIAGYDRDSGAVTVIFQKVGATTRQIDALEEGESLKDFAGPLGKPSELDGYKRAAVIGGGLGVAIAYPQAKALYEAGAKVDLIVGFRNEKLIILEQELQDACHELTIMTDDGSNGNKGFVTQALGEKLKAGAAYDVVIAIGPLMMMKAVSELTRPYGIKTIVSMNSIMVDGTGMCGGCRVTVGGQTRFACVDGPDFDGHEVDFDSAAARGRMYKDQEHKVSQSHVCRLTGE